MFFWLTMLLLWLQARKIPILKPLFYLKEILLEIGFVEEMRTTWGNKEVPQ